MRRDGSKYYRWQADRCRELADRQPNAEVKAHLVGVAGQYDQLADDTATDRAEKSYEDDAETR